MDSLETRTEESILPVRGETVVVKCFFNTKHTAVVPTYLFDPKKRSHWHPHGEIKEEFHGRELENHAFISPCGSIYCRRECWSLYCDD